MCLCVCVCVFVLEVAYCIHVDAIGVGPGMLEVFLQPLPEAAGDLVEADELFDPQHLGVVARRA